MARVYNDNTAAYLKNAIASGEATLERQEYGFFDKLNMAGICIELFIDKVTGKRMGQLIIHAQNINTEYIKIWKTYAPGRFLISDYRKDVRDKEGNCPYFIVKYKGKNERPMRAIVRELFEIAPRMREDMKDFELNGKYYSIVKICPDNPEDPTWLSGINKVDIMHTLHIDEPQVPDYDNDSDIEVDPDVATTYISY